MGTNDFLMRPKRKSSLLPDDEFQRQKRYLTEKISEDIGVLRLHDQHVPASPTPSLDATAPAYAWQQFPTYTFGAQTPSQVFTTNDVVSPQLNSSYTTPYPPPPLDTSLSAPPPLESHSYISPPTPAPTSFYNNAIVLFSAPPNHFANRTSTPSTYNSTYPYTPQSSPVITTISPEDEDESMATPLPIVPQSLGVGLAPPLMDLPPVIPLAEPSRALILYRSPEDVIASSILEGNQREARAQSRPTPQHPPPYIEPVDEDGPNDQMMD
eukprot:TRINITY_DN3112_c0_g1_i2.p1 TRINITY_DN3112_c0_g1~~TRINITY_DN3112_c0_g1_i2.p1  ORF type:complete len:277 (-),score=63.48 TRINITY_DN3112_c0_g1_i2:156-959(-)